MVGGDCRAVTELGINNVLQLAAHLGAYLEGSKLPYCFIGGVAYQRWGEPRQTVDVEGTVFVGFGKEEPVIKDLLSQFDSRIDNPMEFAIRHRIVLLESPQGIGIDISLGGLDYELRVTERASTWVVPEHGHIRTCSAEDLVTLKAFASRPQDWIDVEKVIIRQGNRLDRGLIRQELAPLVELKEEPKIMEHLEQLFAKHP